jgi:antitoxin VapB
MTLRIEAPETVRIIRELARRTGLSEERAVETAARERLALLRTPEDAAERWKRVHAIAKDLQARLEASGQRPDEVVYDENHSPMSGQGAR